MVGHHVEEIEYNNNIFDIINDIIIKYKKKIFQSFIIIK
jgi:hypothetical protein